MAKNMTRKGLAAASTFALAVAGLVGIATPAAANTMVLEPSVGDSNRVPISESFTLQGYHAAADNIYNKNLSVQIVDGSESLTSFTTPDGTTGSASRDSADFTFYGEISTTAGATYDITLTPESAADETFSVVVTTFFDSPGGNQEPDSGEIQQSFEVFFHIADDYTWNMDFTSPAFADNTFKASVSTTPALNLAQFEAKVKVGFATIASNGDLTARDGIATFTSQEFTQGTNGASSDAEVSADGSSIGYEVNVVDSESTVSPANTVRNASYAAGLVFDGTEVARSLAVVSEATVQNIDTPVAVAGPDVSGTNVRKESSSITFEAQVESDGSDTPAAAGEEMTVTITDSTFDADSTLAAGGETLTAATTGGNISFTVLTGADGKASFTADVSDVVTGDSFAVEFSAQGQTANASFTVKETVASDLVEHNLLGTGADWKVEDGTHTIRFAALDNFGQPLSSSDFRVFLTPTDETGVYTTDQQAAALSGGVATFSVDTTSSRDKKVTSFEAELKVASGASFATIGGGITETLTVNIGSSNAATDVTISGYDSNNGFDPSGTVDLSTAVFASANERLGETFDDTSNLGSPETLAGSIQDVSGLNTYGNVTISGEGLLFKVSGGGGTSYDVYSVGSATVQTSTAGDFGGVSVYSNKAGEQTVTVSSGSASQEIIIEFAPAESDAGTNLTIDAPSAVEPGSTLVYTVSLTDDFGNPVDGGSQANSANDVFELAYDGPGFIVSDALSGISTMGADGKVTVTIFLGNNDDGKTGTLTASYSTNDADFTDDGDLVVQKTVNIGDVPGAAGEFNAWTKLSDDLTNVKFYAKNPSNQGKIQFFFNGDEIAWHRGTSATSYEGGDPFYNVDQDAYYLVRDRDLVSGIKNVFEIYQDGERIWRAVKTLD